MRRLGTSVIRKSIDVIMKLSLVENEVTINNKSFYYPPIKEIVYSPTLKRKDNCVACGRCCIGFSLVFLPGETIPNVIKNRLEFINIIVNNRNVKIGFYRQQKVRKDNGCDFLKGELTKIHTCQCMIHDSKPIHCAMPHLRFQNNIGTNKTTIMKTQFGRNWAVGCPVLLNDIDEYEPSLRDIKKLEIISKISKELGILSLADDIIKDLNNLQLPPRHLFK